LELAEKVILYYSFKGDVVLDPFAGSGTVGAAAAKLERRFVLFDVNSAYVDLIRDSVGVWLGKAADEVLWMNCSPMLLESI
jgi:DNA modification methylase